MKSDKELIKKFEKESEIIEGSPSQDDFHFLGK